jgi:DNA-nicking Smr family endonuclease
MTSADDSPPLDDETPVAIPIEDSLDLHTFAPREVSTVVEEYLFQCYQKGFREVRIIHGRGRGVQRRMVRAVLERSPWVVGFKDAPLEAGGWGATLVRLVTHEPRSS